MRVSALLLALPLLANAGTPPVDYHAPPPDPPGAGKIPNAPPLQDRLIGPGPFQNLPSVDESRLVQLTPIKQPYWTFGKVDPVLTEACQLAQFFTPPYNRITLQFVGTEGRAMFQVVPPLYHHLLVDLRKLARPGVTYYFFDSGQPSCEVRVDSLQKIGFFPQSKGSALPPPDPKAQAKRLALFKSWLKP